MNGPVDDDLAEMDHPRSPQGVDECGMYGITRCTPSVDVSLERLGICPRQDAAHPNFTTLESRLESYSSWPRHIKLRPEVLSDAGFYYTGTGDRTICFQCAGGLKDWEENDDPWKEHARYFSKCTYLIQKKGRDFINEVVGRKFPPVASSSSSFEEPQSNHATPATSRVEHTRLHPDCDSDVASSGYNSGGSSLEESSVSKASTSSFEDNPLNPDCDSGLSSGGSFFEESSRSSQESKVTKPETKTLDDQRACKICYAEEMGVVFLPCGHLVSCVNCAPSLKTCAVCRKPFSATVRAYLS